ncbi:MAG TPA: CoA transferase [Acetobacteraceae bacterium]|nr:CoA transferase [Acetobacteraceae bacterium]
MQRDAPGPLSGLRVIDLTTVVSGPVCTALLADQGASVIKIEPPEGDITRRTAGDGDFTAMFVACNRGKRSLALDLKQRAACDVVRRLAAAADVFVQNFRPGAMDRLGLGADALRTLNRRLVYVSISGVGEAGPYAKQRVYDPVIQSLSGLADVQTDAETGRPRMVRTIIADKTTGAFAAQAICAALFARERSGEGQHVRLSMLDAMVAFLWPEAMSDQAIPGRAKAAGPQRPDLIFRTADGFITAGSISNAEWRGLCTALGRPEWIDDPRFGSPAARSANAAERLALVGAVLATRPTQEWLARLTANDVPCAPVLRRDEVLTDPQVVHNGLIETIDQPGLGQIRQARPAARFGGTPAAIRGPAPSIGQHTESVLAALGLAPAEIAALVASGAASIGKRQP